MTAQAGNLPVGAGPADATVYDVVVVGSGAAGLVAALAAAEQGATVGLFEKAQVVGGTTAISGGTVWVPNNHHMTEIGLADSRDEGLAYLRSLSLGLIDDEFARLIVDEGPDVVRWLEGVSPLRFEAIPGFPDYHPERPGGKPGGGRSLDPVLFPFVELGGWAERVGRSHRNRHLRLTDTPLGGGSGVIADDVLAERAVRDLRGCGNGLIGPLLKALLDRGIEPQLGVPARDLIVRHARVSGVEFHTDGARRVYARHGVVLATGGFEWAPELVRQFLRGPMTSPASLPHNTGDGLLMAMRCGAALGNMSEAWWVPTLRAPGDEVFGRQRAHLVLRERTLPRSIMINSTGRRFTNEAASYNALAGAFHVLDPGRFDYPNLPCWLVFDQGFVEQYGFHTTRAGEPVPDWISSGSSAPELAERLGVAPAALAATISRWNSLAQAGDDSDFGRGRSAYDRWSGDARYRGTVRSTLGPLDQPPYYAVQLHSGCLGTKGGPRTDRDGRVLDTRGAPILGLYAAGNAAAAPTGRAYPGAGGTLGPILILARRAGQHAAHNPP